MTKTEERRLDRVEGSLSPKEAFLLWMGEAHEHQSWAAYVMSLKDQPIEQHPMRRLPKLMEDQILGPKPGQVDYQLDATVRRAVREVCFYLELHEALTSRLALEWKALALQSLVAVGQARRLMEDQERDQQDIDQTRQWVVNALGDLLLWQRGASLVSERYLDGREALFPDQTRRLGESITHAEHVLALVNDHLEWLQYLQEHGKTKVDPTVNLDAIDLAALRSAVERQATPMIDQMVAMAKAEAATFVHEPKLAIDLLDRVWGGLG